MGARKIKRCGKNRWIIIIIISLIFLTGEDNKDSDFINFLNNIKNIIKQFKEREEKKKKAKHKKETVRKALINKLSIPPAVVKKVVIDVKPPSNAPGQNLPKDYSNKNDTNTTYSNRNAIPFLKKENPSTIPIFTKTLKKLNSNIDKIYKNLQGTQNTGSIENVNSQLFAELTHYHIMLMKEVLRLPATLHRIFNEFPSFYITIALKCNYFSRFVEKYPYSEKDLVINLLKIKDGTTYRDIYPFLSLYREIINIKDNDKSEKINKHYQHKQFV